MGLNLQDFHARQYDPQIGRFWGIDPMSQFPSGYTGMGNDPANSIDPTGMQRVGVSTASMVAGRPDRSGNEFIIPQGEISKYQMLTDASGVTTVTLVSSIEADGSSYVLGGAGGPSDGLGTGISENAQSSGYDIFGGKSIAALSKDINGASAPSLHDLEVSLQPGQNSNTVTPSQGNETFDMNNPVLAAGGDGNGLSTAKTVIDAMEPALSTQEYLIGLAAKSAPANYGVPQS